MNERRVVRTPRTDDTEAVRSRRNKGETRRSQRLMKSAYYLFGSALLDFISFKKTHFKKTIGNQLRSTGFPTFHKGCQVRRSHVSCEQWTVAVDQQLLRKTPQNKFNGIPNIPLYGLYAYIDPQVNHPNVISIFRHCGECLGIGFMMLTNSFHRPPAGCQNDPILLPESRRPRLFVDSRRTSPKHSKYGTYIH